MKKKAQLKKYLRLYLTGFAMGTADLVPGVSGGTVALISGIYEELLGAVKIMTGRVVKLFLRLKIKDGIRTTPFAFVLPLAAGIFSALIGLAGLLKILLSDYPVFIWSFFFGLILASTVIVIKRVSRWDPADRIAFVASTIFSYILMGAIPTETPNTLLFIFFSGAIAICAMILPGISGSFILLLLGKYQQILTAVVERNILTLSVFIAGCVFGLALFSRFLSWLFARHHDISVAVLSGFMLGSIRKIWPWKEVVTTRINSHGQIVPLVEKNILPAEYDVVFISALAICVAGFLLVLFLNRLKKHQK